MPRARTPWVVAVLCASVVLVASAMNAEDQCANAKCVGVLAARLNRSLGATTAADFTRVWSRRGAGSYFWLYVLPDGTYRRTSIDDTGLHLDESGRWSAAQGVLVLQPSGRGPASPGAPSAYVAFRNAGSRKRTLIVRVAELSAQIGSARSAADEPTVMRWLDLNGLEAGPSITDAEMPRILKELSRFEPVP
jgi:hypothetical protein